MRLPGCGMGGPGRGLRVTGLMDFVPGGWRRIWFCEDERGIFRLRLIIGEIWID